MGQKHRAEPSKTSGALYHSVTTCVGQYERERKRERERERD